MSVVQSICILSSVLGQGLSNRQTVFFLLADPMDSNHKDPDVIDLNAPRRAQYLHKAWKRHQVAVDQRPKLNHKDAILPALPQEPYLLVKEFGLILNQENIQSPILEVPTKTGSSSSSWKSTSRQ